MSAQFYKPRPMSALRHLLTLAACVLGASGGQAQTITSTGGLSFGSFVAATGGVIAITPSGGRSKTGDMFLVQQGDNSSAAQFIVIGTITSTYAITLPADGTVLLWSSSHTMAINGFTSHPSGTGTLSGGGAQILSVGARLTVGNAQAPGSYTGAFLVTVNYN